MNRFLKLKCALHLEQKIVQDSVVEYLCIMHTRVKKQTTRDLEHSFNIIRLIVQTFLLCFQMLLQLKKKTMQYKKTKNNSDPENLLSPSHSCMYNIMLSYMNLLLVNTLTSKGAKNYRQFHLITCSYLNAIYRRNRKPQDKDVIQ